MAGYDAADDGGGGSGGGCVGSGGVMVSCPWRSARSVSWTSRMQWLRSTIAAVVYSGENTGAGATTDPSGSDGVTTTPEVAGGAVVESGAVVEAAGDSMIGKVSDTRLIGLDALPELLCRL